jgi:hypothetical protein
VSEAGYRMPCKPPRRRRYRRSSTPRKPGRNQPSRQESCASSESNSRSLGSRFRLAAAVLGRAQRSRRNVVAGVGVRLVEPPDAPSWGAVNFCTPSGRSCGSTRRQRDALGDIHPSGDVESLHAPAPSPRSRSRWFVCAAASRMLTDMEMATFITSSLIGQAGGDSGSLVAESVRRSHFSEPASWKDPL